MDQADQFRACVPRYLGREWTNADGSSRSRLDACERRLERALPESLRSLHLNLGEVSELLGIHNRVLPLEEIVVEGEYLVFMEENQSVVSWGIPLARIAEPDPIVWQRNNTPPVEWFAEDTGVMGLLVAMWNWYVELGLLENANK